MSYRPHASRRRTIPRAYTLIELLLVIVLLGIAGALLVPHLVDQSDLTVQAAVRKLIADLSFAQSDALAHQELRRVQFYDDGRGYCLYRVDEGTYADDFDPDLADYILDPLGAQQQYVTDFTLDDRFEGVSIIEVDLDGGEEYLVYDPLGGTIKSGGLPGTGGTIQVGAGEDVYEVTVSPFTGKLTVQKL